MNILFSALISSFALLSCSQVLACDFAGSLPCERGRHPETTKAWWKGAWATRMQDQTGRNLTAFTSLAPDGSYRSTLKYDDGEVVQHSGKYRVRFRKLDVATSEKITPELISKAHAIDSATKSGFPKEYASFAAALPVGIKSGDQCTCTVGEVTYDVKSWKPRNLDFGAPQTFEFIVVGNGYVRVTGPGVTDALSRRYAYR